MLLHLMVRLTSLALMLAILGVAPSLAQTPSGWLAHDMDRPRPPIVKPAPQALPVQAPPDALVLFDGKNLDHWRSAEGGPALWRVEGDFMESVPDSGYLYSAQGFGDVQLHVEWATPTPPAGRSQGRGNSGVFLMGKYEVQVLDSYENDTYPDGQAAAIYGQYPPLVNACLPPGEWQSYDIVFRRPRFDQEGALLIPARLTVIHNGVLVHDAREVWGPTAWLQHHPYDTHADRLPLALQDHGNPVRFRNIWLRELPESDPPDPAPPAIRRYFPVSQEALATFAGDYVDEEGSLTTIVHEDERLWLIPSERSPLELVPHAAGEFSMRWTAGRIAFQRNDQGDVVGLEFLMGGEKYRLQRVQEIVQSDAK